MDSSGVLILLVGSIFDTICQVAWHKKNPDPDGGEQRYKNPFIYKINSCRGSKNMRAQGHMRERDRMAVHGNDLVVSRDNELLFICINSSGRERGNDRHMGGKLMTKYRWTFDQGKIQHIWLTLDR